jgi:predicted kinase
MAELDEQLKKLSLVSRSVRITRSTKQAQSLLITDSVKRTTRTKKTAATKENPCTALRFKGFLKRSSKAQEKPLLIFMIGPVASGKTTTLNTLLPSNFKFDYYNLDDYHEYLLEQQQLIQTDKTTKLKYKNVLERGVDLLYESYQKEGQTITKVQVRKMVMENPKLIEPIYNSLFNKLLATANKCIEEDIDRLLAERVLKNTVIDTTGGNYAKIKKIKEIMEAKGYETLMIALYASLDTTKFRNEQRYRTVPFGGVYSSWLNTVQNIVPFKDLFKDDFYLINTDGMVYPPNITLSVPRDRTKKSYKKYELNFDGKIEYGKPIIYYTKDIKDEIYRKILLRQGQQNRTTTRKYRTKIDGKDNASI